MLNKTITPKIEDCPMVHCVNCGTEYQGLYCPVCGQSADTKRFTVKYAVQYVLASFVGGDNIFVRTMVNLWIRPGHMIREYLWGQRARYFPPIQFLVAIITILASLTYFFGVSDSFNNIDTVNVKVDPANVDNFNAVISKVTELLKDKTFTSIFGALVSIFPYRWLFRNHKIRRHDGTMSALNIAEHFYVQIYRKSLFYMYFILLYPLLFFDCTQNILSTIYSILMVTIPIRVYHQLLGTSWIRTSLFVLITYAITIIIMGVTIILFFGFYYGFKAVAN